MAGWLLGPERTVVSSAELAVPATLRFTLWPFDRPESRGRLQSVSVRRSAGEVLLLGLRSSAYWQVRVRAWGGARVRAVSGWHACWCSAPKTQHPQELGPAPTPAPSLLLPAAPPGRGGGP